MNFKYSCYIDSFYTIFIFSLLKELIKDDLYKTNKFQYENKNNKEIFKYIINFVIH